MNEIHTEFEKTDPHGSYVGMRFDLEYAKQYLRKDVSDRFYNKKQIENVLASVNQAQMSIEDLTNKLKSNVRLEGWRIGEYIAIVAIEKFFGVKICHDPNLETTSTNEAWQEQILLEQHYWKTKQYS